jgi:hypothetical protein
MPTLIPRPPVIEPHGHKPKRIEEDAGRVNSAHSGVMDVVHRDAWKPVVHLPGS